jgi:hypothetical protein
MTTQNNPADREAEAYIELGKALKEMQESGEIANDAIDWETGNSEDTIYDVNPLIRQKYFKFVTSAICAGCNKEIPGSIILKKKDLTVVDTGGFVILFDSIMCNACLRERGNIV